MNGCKLGLSTVEFERGTLGYDKDSKNQILLNLILLLTPSLSCTLHKNSFKSFLFEDARKGHHLDILTVYAYWITPY